MDDETELARQGYEAYKSGQAKLLPYEKGANTLTKVGIVQKKTRVCHTWLRS